MYNGRLNLTDPRSGVAPGHGQGEFNQAFAYRQETASSDAAAQVRGVLEETPLNMAYFSPANIQILQNKIRREVYEKSNGEMLIDPQSVDQLLQVMRAMYLQYGKNQPNNIPGQIAELNDLVAEWCVPKIMAEVGMYKVYLNDVQNMPTPLERPVYISQSGTKAQTLDRFF